MMRNPFESGELEKKLRSQVREHLQKVERENDGMELPVMIEFGELAGIALRSHIHAQLRRERKKARILHAGYDFNRHLSLHMLAKKLDGQDPSSSAPPRLTKAAPMPGGSHTQAQECQ